MATKFENGLPFVLDIEPDIEKNASVNPKHVVHEFIHRSPWITKPRVTVDAGFSGKIKFHLNSME
jgi:hypothetical protein